MTFRRNKASPLPRSNARRRIAGVTRDIPCSKELDSKIGTNDSLKKGMRMNKNRFAKPVAVAVGFLFLFAVPGLTRAQSSPPTPAPTPRKTLPAARPKKDTHPADDFAGLQYTDEQKARIDQIHQDMKSRSEEHTSELQSLTNLVCRLLLEKKKTQD